MKIKIVKEICDIKELFKELNLEENSLYLVEVQKRSTNPAYKSFLFTGFKNGNYCYVYNNSTGQTPLEDFFSIKIIKKLYSEK